MSEAKRMLRAQGAPALGTALATNRDLRAAAEERLEEALTEAGVSAVRTLTEMRRLAYADPRRLFDEDGDLRKPHELDDDAAATLSSIEVKTRRWQDRQGNDQEEETSKVRTWDKNGALGQLARIQGLAPERVEVTGRGGGPIVTEGGESTAGVVASLLALIQPKGDPKK